LRDVLELDGGVRVPRVFVSAASGEGLDGLRQVLAEAVLRSADLIGDEPAPHVASTADARDLPDADDGEEESNNRRTGTHHTSA